MMVVKRFTFEAAHFLPGYEGACANLHGHSYKLEIGVSAGCLNEQSMVIDFKQLKQIVQDVIIKQFDHTCINDWWPLKVPPTAEAMINYIGACLDMELPGLFLIRLWETEDSYAEWRA
uniref:Putative 6-Pyruvoyl tetrahydrobiopterin synthase n=1 Tax=viral metagenome TaxID=1070528 RepID=A0A6M3XMY4_9ZZZZ